MSSDRAPFHLGYRRSLDGIRGVAILFVLLVHGQIIPDGFAFMAVNTFFVLSGFLITCLLVEEWDKSGTISFRAFYIRRALRLLPALIVMLAAFLIFAFFFEPPKRFPKEVLESLRALFYFTNWASIFRIGRTVTLVHTWSLSIEEQFYLVWPILLFWLLRKTTRASMINWIFLGAFLSLAIRVALCAGGTDSYAGNVYPSVNRERIMVGLDTRADSLLLGCLGGVLLSSNLLPAGKTFLPVLRWLGPIFAGALLVSGTFSFLSPPMMCAGLFVISTCGAVVILHQVVLSGSLLHWVLENPFLVYIGRISYGLYVWNYPIVVVMQQHHWPWQNLRYLIPVFAVVLASYYLVERPFLSLKKNFQKTP